MPGDPRTVIRGVTNSDLSGIDRVNICHVERPAVSLAVASVSHGLDARAILISNSARGATCTQVNPRSKAKSTLAKMTARVNDR